MDGKDSGLFGGVIGLQADVGTQNRRPNDRKRVKSTPKEDNATR